MGLSRQVTEARHKINMEVMKKHFAKALAMGENFVDQNPTFCQTEHLQKLEKQYRVSRAYWFLGIFSMLILTLLLIGGLRLIVNLVGFAYPALASFQAIESPNNLLSKQWLSYWIIFGGFFAFENSLPFLVAGFRYYSICKAAILVCCFNPSTQGASFLYDAVFYSLIVKQLIPPGTTKIPKYMSAAGAGEAVAIASRAVSSGVSAVQKGSGPPVTVLGVEDARAPDQTELRVVVVSASDVVETEAPGATADCDPYCVLEVLPEGSRPKDGAAENTKYKTVCKTGTANPVWNEGVTIPNVMNLDAKLVVTLCNKRAMGRDQCLGKIEVPLSRVKGKDFPLDMVMGLSPADGATEPAHGDLRVSVHLK